MFKKMKCFKEADTDFDGFLDYCKSGLIDLAKEMYERTEHDELKRQAFLHAKD
jgi:hypothetical protein